MSKDTKYEAYQFEVGVLLNKDDEEYEYYNQVWDYNNGYYNENWGFTKKYDEALQFIDNYVKNGSNNTYGIISCIKVDKEEFNSIYNGSSEIIDMDYDLSNVICSKYKNKDNEIIENFIDINVKINENEESEEL